MSRNDRGHYTLKHPAGTRVSRGLENAVRAASHSAEISCAEAHAIAAHLDITPGEVGIAADLMEIRIIQCQLGLFNHEAAKTNNPSGPQADDDPLAPAMAKCLDDGRLSCADAWQLADTHSRPRDELGRMCDRVGIKIRACQLGAF